MRHSDISNNSPVSLVEGVQSQVQRVFNLISTRVGERLFNNFGCNLDQFRHRIMDDDLGNDILDYVIDLCAKYLSDVSIDFTRSSVEVFSDSFMIRVYICLIGSDEIFSEDFSF